MSIEKMEAKRAKGIVKQAALKQYKMLKKAKKTKANILKAEKLLGRGILKMYKDGHTGFQIGDKYHNRFTMLEIDKALNKVQRSMKGLISFDYWSIGNEYTDRNDKTYEINFI